MAAGSEIEPLVLPPPHDAPKALVMYVLDELHSSNSPVIFYESWAQTGSTPELRHYINQAGLELAPVDLDLREKVIRAMLGLLAVEDHSGIVSDLEAAFNSQDANPDSNAYQLSFNLTPNLVEAA